MSFIGAFRREQLSSQAPHIGRPGGNLSMAEVHRIRQMGRILQQTLDELEQVKTRLNQLEKAMAERGEQDIAACGSSGQQTPVSMMPPLPIAEISQLAEMAKRLR
jgi:hypothetical protein